MLSQDQIAAYEKAHGRVFYFTADDVDIVLKAPLRAAYKAYRRDISNPEAVDDLVKTMLVTPSLQEFDKLLDKYPALCEHKQIDHQIALWVGLRSEDDEKKLEWPGKPSLAGRMSLPTPSDAGQAAA